MPTYSDAPDVKELVDEFIESLDLYHIDKKRVLCVRSKGSKAGGTLARIHSFPKVYQKALGMRPVYIIEVISENFDKIEEAEKVTNAHGNLKGSLDPSAVGSDFCERVVQRRSSLRALFAISRILDNLPASISGFS
ncbi:MAG: putative metallopeptidase [Thermoproteota archaeon]